MIAAFKHGLARLLGPGHHTALFWKGRVALYAILQAMGVGEGDEVILPAFTCVAVPNAILYRGARPIYCEIDPDTYTLDVERVAARITRRTRVILAQNSFGLSPDLDPILELARRHGVWVVEDCAHGLGGAYRGRPNGTTADASFFSTQWSKPISTGLGGIAVTRHPELARRLKALERRALWPTVRERVALAALRAVERRFLTRRTWFAAVRTYRFLSRHDLVLGSSQGHELEKPLLRGDFVKGFSSTQARLGVAELADLPARLAHRARIARRYQERLGTPAPPAHATHGHLKHPVRVTDRARLFSEAERRGLELGDWFVSPIHPIVEDVHHWHYQWGSNPIAEAASRQVVSLPTHARVDEAYADEICALVAGFRP
jgi:perosamine synthetase